MNWRGMITAVASEPYRLWYPLGIGLGMVGVALWPLWSLGLVPIYPGPAHVRLMIEGFFTAFILGFLGTAGPRMLGVPTLSPRLWAGLLVLWLGGHLATLANLGDVAELAFALTLLIFLISLIRRLGARDGLPPPGFVLVGVALVGAIFAALLQLTWLQRWGHDWPAGFWRFGRSFLVEGYVLLPILGAAPFFLGRFGGLPPAHPDGDGPTPDARWWRQARLCLWVGLGLIGAWGLQAAGFVRVGALLQSGLTAWFVWTQIPWRYPRPVSTLGQIAQISLLCLVLAPLAKAMWPAERLAWAHLLVIPGFQWMVVCVGTWVVFAHAGHKARLMKPWPAMLACSALWLIATLVRIVAEFQLEARSAWLDSAAGLWLVASAAWLILLLPRLREDG